MEIKQILGRIIYTQIEWTFIKGMPPLIGNEWKAPLPRPPWVYGDRKKIDAIKQEIKKALRDLQGECCAYCGLPFEETSGSQIEHIAPKGIYPEFTFFNTNLVLSCSLCNGFLKKERKNFKNTISKYNSIYDNCLFNIVHPYLDDPLEHFNFNNKKGDIIIISKSIKGQKSIAMFDLTSPIQASARGKYLMKQCYHLSSDLEDLLNQTLMNNYSQK